MGYHQEDYRRIELKVSDSVGKAIGNLTLKVQGPK